jgi:hypothetical protein
VVLSSSARPVRSAAFGLAELSGLVHDGAGALAAAVRSRVAQLARTAAPALSPSQHDSLRAAALAMDQALTAAAETLTLALGSTADDLEVLLRPPPASGRGLHRHRAAPLTPSQRHALHVYTTVDGVDLLNRHLRHPAGTPEERRAEVQRLVDDAVAGLAALPRFDGVSYRGTTLPEADLPRWQPGVVVADRGFASSSASAPVAEAFRCGGNAFITIAGRSGADIRSLSYFADEAEVLFAPGTRFRVVGRAWDHRRQCWSFQIEEVDPCASTATPTTA